MLMPTLPKAADLPPPFLLLSPKLGDAIEVLLPVAQMMCTDLPRAQSAPGLQPSLALLVCGAPNFGWGCSAAVSGEASWLQLLSGSSLVKYCLESLHLPVCGARTSQGNHRKTVRGQQSPQLHRSPFLWRIFDIRLHCADVALRSITSFRHAFSRLLHSNNSSSYFTGN